MLNIAVLVSGGGTNLQALIDAQGRGEIPNGKISLVLSSKQGVKAIERAEKAGIPYEVLIRKECSSQDDYDTKLLKILSDYSIDLVVLAGFMTIISERVVSHFKNKIINIHPSLIPSFCGEGFYGLKVHEKALEKGVKVSGATVHFVNGKCDDGPIILQKAVYVQNGDTAETLQRRIMEEAEWVILPKAVSHFCDGKIKVTGNIATITD